MKIGIWVNEPLNKHSGGSFTYLNTLIAGIDSFTFNPQIEIVFLSNYDLSNFHKPFINVKSQQRGIPLAVKLIRKGLKLVSKTIFKNPVNFIDQKEKKIKDNSIAAYLQKQGIRIIFYPLPSSQIIDGIPYILNNWDLAHFTTYAFPEIFEDSGFNKRNNWYVNIMQGALLIFCETETGKKEIAHYLNLNPAKIRVLPIFPSGRLTGLTVEPDDQLLILQKMNLAKHRFFFYPAQFWAHKNHYTAIKAFQQFVLQQPDFKLLFCGSDKGNEAYLKTCVKTFGLEKNVIFGGFIDDNALYTLYKNAMALLMPTFLGPSNIPPIEAMNLECPVLCSDLNGHKEIMNNAALYFNPADELSILTAMRAITDDSTRLQILRNQKEQLKTTNHTIQKALTKMDAHLVEAVNIRNCWG